MMPPYNLEDLSHTGFDIKNITARKEIFADESENDYLQNGREHNLLHIITSGTRMYITPEHRFTVTAGTVLLIPGGTKYFTRVVKSRDCECSGIGICFDLTDGDGSLLSVVQDVYHDWNDYHGLFLQLFLEISQACTESSYYVLRIKSLLFRLLSHLLCDDQSSQLTRSIIAPALSFLAGHYRDNLPVRAYAEICSMSESYFRKKFLEYTGKSPIRYRNELRFQEARRLYLEGKSIQEIAESLGFEDASYFTKLYKQYTGCSLKTDADVHIV